MHHEAKRGSLVRVEHHRPAYRASDWQKRGQREGTNVVPRGRLAKGLVRRKTNLTSIDEVCDCGLGAVWQVRLELQALASSRSCVEVCNEEIRIITGGELDTPFAPIQLDCPEAHEPRVNSIYIMIQPRDEQPLLLLPEMLNHSRNGYASVSVWRPNACLARCHFEPPEVGL